MKKHLFITGTSSPSLSALLRSVLGDRLGYAGGYVAERIPVSPDPDEFDYMLFPACHAAGYEGLEGESFFRFTWTDTDKNTEVFRTLGKRLVEEAMYYPYAVLDCFGGFELLVPEFRGALADLLSSDVPVIGVILTKDEVMEFKNLYGLGDKLDLYLDTLRNALKKDIDTEIVDASALSPDRLRALLENWAAAYAVM